MYYCKNLLLGDDELNELKSVLQKLEQTSAGGAADGEDNISAEFESAISQVIKSLSVPGENLQVIVTFNLECIEILFLLTRSKCNQNMKYILG